MGERFRVSEKQEFSVSSVDPCDLSLQDEALVERAVGLKSEPNSEREEVLFRDMPKRVQTPEDK
jgi:hypothetical protein